MMPLLLMALLTIISLVVIILLTVSQKDVILIPDLKIIHDLFRDPKPPLKTPSHSFISDFDVFHSFRNTPLVDGQLASRIKIINITKNLISSCKAFPDTQPSQTTDDVPEK